MCFAVSYLSYGVALEYIGPLLPVPSVRLRSAFFVDPEAVGRRSDCAFEGGQGRRGRRERDVG